MLNFLLKLFLYLEESFSKHFVFHKISLRDYLIITYKFDEQQFWIHENPLKSTSLHHLLKFNEFISTYIHKNVFTRTIDVIKLSRKKYTSHLFPSTFPAIMISLELGNRTKTNIKYKKQAQTHMPYTIHSAVFNSLHYSHVLTLLLICSYSRGVSVGSAMQYTQSVQYCIPSQTCFLFGLKQ